jgi:hypothetical protein
LSGAYRLGDSSVRAVRKLRNQELDLPDKPRYKLPQIPPDISSVLSEDLIVLMSEICAWLDYAEVQLAAAQIDEEYEKMILAEISGLAQLENASQSRVTLIKAKMQEDESYINQRDKTHNAYAYRKMIETMYLRLDRAKFIVSREITRRADK